MCPKIRIGRWCGSKELTFCGWLRWPPMLSQIYSGGTRKAQAGTSAASSCQGAALHYVDGRNGVKDFDVWSFYAQYEDWLFPARWRGTRDFGPSRFGRYPGDPPGYSGRRVDLLGRSLPVEPSADLAGVLHRYLAVGWTGSARALAAKAVVLIDSENRAGEVVWPASGVI
jgi:hypothetical protein